MSMGVVETKGSWRLGRLSNCHSYAPCQRALWEYSFLGAWSYAEESERDRGRRVVTFATEKKN